MRADEVLSELFFMGRIQVGRDQGGKTCFVDIYKSPDVLDGDEER